MLSELLFAAMINPDMDKLNLIAKAEEKTKPNVVVTQKIEKTKLPFTQLFVIQEDNRTNMFYFDEIQKYYEGLMNTVIKDFSKRTKNPKEFLKWVDLPSEQLAKHGVKSHLDEIYAQAETLKSRKSDKERALVVLGIGGSKHTAEFLLNMNGVGNKGKVYFYSDIDPVSFENFLGEVNRPVSDLNFLVVSKSGTTFETKDGFLRFEKMLFNHYKKQGLNDNDALRAAQSHFAICTDKTPNEKNLRGKIGNKNGKDNNYIKELYIHDGVGGRFSMFDDAGLFAAAYAGVSKEKATRILKSAAETSKKCLNTDLTLNPAARSAMFNLYAYQFGYKLKQQQYFGRLFEGGGENWIKQLYLESLKDFYFNATKAPDSMHYASEGFFYPANRDKYNVVMTVMSPEISPNYKKYLGAILVSYAEKVPVEMEILDVEDNAIKPEAIGEYVQAKHFEIVYTGMLRRQAKAQMPEKLPEVFQSHVEVYKNKFKPKSPYELTPGQ